LGTPWQADTIMGHIAWLVAYQEGDNGVKKFLTPFLKGNPPFVLSDGFPSGLLPRPMGQKQSAKVKDLDSYIKERRERKTEFLNLIHFDAIRRGQEIEIETLPSPWEEVETLHAVISRTTGTTTDEAGNLFADESLALKRELGGSNSTILTIYTCCLGEWTKKVEKLFRDLSLMGFGRDKSVGLGHFEFVGIEPWDGFSNFGGSNGFISLSTYVPAVNDPTDGKWALNVKYGKLGENIGGGNPFKRPLMQIKPGAIFYAGGRPKPFYGRVVLGLAPGFPDAVQICYCLAVPCKI